MAGIRVLAEDDKTVLVTPSAFSELLEYSCSLPSRTTIGKQWKCNTTFGREGYDPNGPWMIGEYIEHPDPKRVGIRWRELIVEEI